MYLATLSTVIGAALILRESVLLAYAAECLAFLLLLVYFFEEPSLRRKFGAAYDRYCQTTSRWVPHLPSGRGLR